MPRSRLPSILALGASIALCGCHPVQGAGSPSQPFSDGLVHQVELWDAPIPTSPQRLAALGRQKPAPPAPVAAVPPAPSPRPLAAAPRPSSTPAPAPSPAAAGGDASAQPIDAPDGGEEAARLAVVEAERKAQQQRDAKVLAGSPLSPTPPPGDDDSAGDQASSDTDAAVAKAAGAAGDEAGDGAADASADGEAADGSADGKAADGSADGKAAVGSAGGKAAVGSADGKAAVGSADGKAAVGSADGKADGGKVAGVTADGKGEAPVAAANDVDPSKGALPEPPRSDSDALVALVTSGVRAAEVAPDDGVQRCAPVEPPIVRSELGQLQLMMVEPDSTGRLRALIKLPDGKVVTVLRGDRVGPDGGRVVRVEPGEVVIGEIGFDVRGEANIFTRSVRLAR